MIAEKHKLVFSFRLGHNFKYAKRQGAAHSARRHGIISHPCFHGSHSCRAGLSDQPQHHPCRWLLQHTLNYGRAGQLHL